MTATTMIDGLPVIDADEPLILSITPDDISHASRKEPRQCPIARACRRSFKASEVRVHLARVYIRRNNHWLRFMTPRYLRSEDEGFFRPLSGLAVGDARVFLGIVLPIDGAAGLRRRQDTAARYLKDFGVAMYCGFGRQPGADGTETMREHARVVREVRASA